MTRDEIEELRLEAMDLSRKISMTSGVARQASEEGERLRKNINEAHRVMTKLKSSTKDYADAAARLSVMDDSLVQSVCMYREILNVTEEAVGDQMTEQIWIKAIEAASHGMRMVIADPRFE